MTEELQMQTSTEDQPLVTLALIAYKQQDIVHEAIEGAFAQTYSPLEILLSDDASPDGTFAIMEEMAANYKGPHVIRLNRNDTNLGIVGHVDRVTELAQGELVVANAGDDISSPNRVERIVAEWLASRRTAHSIHSAFRKMSVLGVGEAIKRPPPGMQGRPSPLEIASGRLFVMGATQAWSKALYRTFGPLGDVPKVEDGPLPFRAALIGEVRYIDEPLVHHRQGGISSRDLLPSARDILYGDYLKYEHWNASVFESHLFDLNKVDYVDRDVCKTVCAENLACIRFRLRLATSNKIDQLCALPGAFYRRWRYGNRKDLHFTLRYAFDKLYIYYFDFRRRLRLKHKRLHG